MLTDAQVRAELERIDFKFRNRWDYLLTIGNSYHVSNDLQALRLLAESQAALGKIEKSLEWALAYPDDYYPSEVLEELKKTKQIARQALKEE